MMPAVWWWGSQMLPPAMVSGKRVLEVGSRNVNGSWRTLIETGKPAEFVGVDIEDGPGVDMVMDAVNLVDKFGEQRWDVVVSTETLEHCEDWRQVVYQMKQSLAPEGVLILTTCAPGFERHDWPSDYWRFTLEVMQEALKELAFLVVTQKGFSILAIGSRNGPVYYPDVEAETV